MTRLAKKLHSDTSTQLHLLQFAHDDVSNCVTFSEIATMPKKRPTTTPSPHHQPATPPYQPKTTSNEKHTQQTSKKHLDIKKIPHPLPKNIFWREPNRASTQSKIAQSFTDEKKCHKPG